MVSHVSRRTYVLGPKLTVGPMDYLSMEYQGT